MRPFGFILLAALTCGAALAQNCDFSEYKTVSGLKAEMAGGVLQLNWQGERDQQLRASFTIRDGQPPPNLAEAERRLNSALSAAVGYPVKLEAVDATATLFRIDLVPGCTVGTGVGLDADGNEVTFAADWRPALALAEALAAGEEVEVLFEDWQVLAWRRP